MGKLRLSCKDIIVRLIKKKKQHKTLDCSEDGWVANKSDGGELCSRSWRF